jgi:hypothetical protein
LIALNEITGKEPLGKKVKQSYSIIPSPLSIPEKLSHC